MSLVNMIENAYKEYAHLNPSEEFKFIGMVVDKNAGGSQLFSFNCSQAEMVYLLEIGKTKIIKDTTGE